MSEGRRNVSPFKDEVRQQVGCTDANRTELKMQSQRRAALVARACMVTDIQPPSARTQKNSCQDPGMLAAGAMASSVEQCQGVEGTGEQSLRMLLRAAQASVIG